MVSEARDKRNLARGVLGASLLLLFTTACAPALVGGGIIATAVGVAALTSHCYDYLDVTVRDAEGRRTCAATVTASAQGDQLELTSCYYAPLTDGRWTLRASLPGSVDAVSTVEVEHRSDCIRHVQSVELTLKRPGSAPVIPAPASASPPAAPPAPSPALPEPASPAAPPPAPAPEPPSSSSAAPVSRALPPERVSPTLTATTP